MLRKNFVKKVARCKMSSAVRNLFASFPQRLEARMSICTGRLLRPKVTIAYRIYIHVAHTLLCIQVSEYQNFELRTKKSIIINQERSLSSADCISSMASEQPKSRQNIHRITDICGTV